MASGVNDLRDPNEPKRQRETAKTDLDRKSHQSVVTGSELVVSSLFMAALLELPPKVISGSIVSSTNQS